MTDRGAKWGQHFLVNRGVADRIVQLFLPPRGEILEIGPGKGILTDRLIKSTEIRDVKITAVELDPELSRRLKNRFSDRIAVMNDDILSIDIKRIYPDRAVSILGNIPYYISGETLDWVIDNHDPVATGVFMLQKEFVEKLVRHRDNPRALVFQSLFEAEICFDVNPGSFSPPPKVKSTVFRFKKRPRHSDEEYDIPGFYEFLKRCFRHRRKTLFNNLLPHYPRDILQQAFTHCVIPPTIRPQQLNSADTYIFLFKKINSL